LADGGGELCRKAGLRRACRPMCWSPLSPSNSARGTSAAPSRTGSSGSNRARATSISQISTACSPVIGLWEMSEQNPRCGPRACARSRPSSACSASMNAGHPAGLLRLGHIAGPAWSAAGLRTVDFVTRPQAECPPTRTRARSSEMLPGGDGRDVLAPGSSLPRRMSGRPCRTAFRCSNGQSSKSPFPLFPVVVPSMSSVGWLPHATLVQKYVRKQDGTRVRHSRSRMKSFRSTAKHATPPRGKRRLESVF